MDNFSNDMITVNDRSQLGFEEKHPFLSRVLLDLVGSIGEGIRNPDRWIGAVAQDNADRRMHRNIARAIEHGNNVEYTKGDMVFKATKNV